MKTRVKFTFPADKVEEPVIYLLGITFDVITNIRRAEVSDVQGWVVLELEGAEKDIKRGLDWVRSKGVRVDPLGGDIIAG
ncbi:MAG: FeS-binding protein [Chloroflexi bacterium]|nr:FeS-binding protein [Chloroflexota bacterium]